MPPRELTKSQRRALRELGGLAHDRELSAELAKLEAAFAQRREGKLDPHDLNDLIHAFHQGPSRELFTLYTSSDKVLAVGGAIARGIIAVSEVPEEARPVRGSAIESFREQAGRGNDEPA